MHDCGLVATYRSRVEASVVGLIVCSIGRTRLLLYPNSEIRDPINRHVISRDTIGFMGQ